MRKIEPIPGSPQYRFLQSSVRELGFGGQAGGAKSFSLILDALGQIHHEHYNAVMFRRTFKQLAGADGLIDLSHRIYPLVGGVYTKSDYLWHFRGYPGTIRFAHLEHEETVHNYDGHQFSWIGFDELQHFSERQYLFLFSRNRASNPAIRPYVRASFNPGGIGHKWIKRRFIDPFKGSDKPRWFKRVNGVDVESGKDDPLAVSRLFIPSRLEDNPYLWQDGKGDYEAGLNQLDDVDYRRLRLGDWDIRRDGLVYHAFNDSCIVPQGTVDLDRCSFYYALDFGAVNEVFGIFAQDQAGVFYLVHEGKLPDMTTQARAARILSHLQGRKVIRGWGGAKSEKQQRLDYQDNGLRIDEPPISDVEGGVSVVNQMFEQGRLKIMAEMVYTIDMLENCVRDGKEGIAEKSIWHHLDVLRYFASGAYKPPSRMVSQTVSASRLLG
jgi:hypothetical protein